MNRSKAHAWNAFFRAQSHPRKKQTESTLSDCLSDYRPSAWWHDEPATDAQIECLTCRGFAIPSSLTKGEACHVIAQPTPKMRKLLENRGRWEDGMTFKEASEEIARVRDEEGWP
jgi:hypothetical protein